MRILGISAFYHDSAAALIRDGAIIAAAQEERFTRRKHDPAFPRNAAAYCLAEEGIALRDIDFVAFYDKPFLKFERLLETYLAFAPRGFRSFAMAIPLWAREKLQQRRLLAKELGELGDAFKSGERILFAEHHLSHAASAFYPSPFREAAILTMDGVGEWATTSLAIGEENRINVVREIHFPHSLGLLYSAFTYYTGFRVNSGEYKLMGLAPYGTPRFAGVIREKLIDVKPDGSFRLDLGYFDYCTGLTMTNAKFNRLFGGPPRKPEEPLEQRHMDLAASVQLVLNEVVVRLARSLAAETGMRNLCLAGGVALNCVANERIRRDGSFADLWIQPAAGDAGGALGAALAAFHLYSDKPREVTGRDAMRGSLLGADYEQTDIEARLRASGARFKVLEEDELIRCTVDALEEQKALGWFRGRMEFGPRALGSRSILADARSPAMQSLLNLKVKYRESFRPFAPAVPRESVSDWFAFDGDSPYMLLVADVATARRVAPSVPATADGSLMERLGVPRSTIPAVTHVDGSARLQTVDRETNPAFHRLLTAFGERTGCPVLVNTSFNVRGEPIVCTPEDAFRCFMGTEIEAMVVGRCFLRKEEQGAEKRGDYASSIAPD